MNHGKEFTATDQTRPELLLLIAGIMWEEREINASALAWSIEDSLSLSLSGPKVIVKHVTSSLKLVVLRRSYNLICASRIK